VEFTGCRAWDLLTVGTTQAFDTPIYSERARSEEIESPAYGETRLFHGIAGNSRPFVSAIGQPQMSNKRWVNDDFRWYSFGDQGSQTCCLRFKKN
jgi:hypothetical protein